MGESLSDPRLRRRSQSPYFRYGQGQDSSSLLHPDPSTNNTVRNQNVVNYSSPCGTFRDQDSAQQNRALLNRERELQRKIDDLEDLLAFKTRQLEAEQGRSERWRHESLEEEIRLKRANTELVEKERLIAEKEKEFKETLSNLQNKMKKLKEDNETLKKDKLEREKQEKMQTSISELQTKYELMKKEIHTKNAQLVKMKADLEQVTVQCQKYNRKIQEMETIAGQAIDLLQLQKRKVSTNDPGTGATASKTRKSAEESGTEMKPTLK